MPKSATILAQCIGTCQHGVWTGNIIQGSSDVLHNSLGGARVGDMGVVSCPYCATLTAVTGSPDVEHNKLSSHREGDTAITPCGTGTTVLGSPDVFDN